MGKSPFWITVKFLFFAALITAAVRFIFSIVLDVLFSGTTVQRVLLAVAVLVIGIAAFILDRWARR